jgi:DNA polymerase I-like protein with 3'-5' exonuclease and polymerase domains
MTNKALAKLYEVPNLKGKDTTGKDEIEYLFEKTGDLVFGKTIELRSYNTVINNYIPNWTPAADGAVHTSWGFKAASGQIDSRAPNVLNISKHTKLGQRFRRIIVAPPGYKFVEADKKSFHVASLGYLANDKDYLRFASLDPHSIFTSYIMPNSWGSAISFNDSDAEILGQCKEIKKRSKAEKEVTGIDLRQDVAKPAVLGNQLGLGPHKLWYKNRRSIQDEGHAKELQSVIKQLFPKTDRWKQDVIDLADRQTYLMDDWGHIQFFYEIYTYKKSKFTGRWEKKRTQEAEQALALLVQGTAFGMLRWEMLQMQTEGILEKYQFNNTIHDSLVFMPTSKDVEQCCRDVEQIMNSPCSVLTNNATGPDGLVVKVELSSGQNLANEGKDNLEGMKEI